MQLPQFSLWRGVIVVISLACLAATAQAQPPDQSATSAVYVPEIEQQWIALRAKVGMGEFTDTAAAIKTYQQFYETQGAHSAITSIQISNTIAQLYWQVLHNQQKALEIYDWALKNYGYLSQSSLLKNERDFVAENGDFISSVDVEPVTIGAAPDGKSTSPSKVLLAAKPPTPTAPPDTVHLPAADVSPTPVPAPDAVVLNVPHAMPTTPMPGTIKVLTPSSPAAPAPDGVTLSAPHATPATPMPDAVKVLSPPAGQDKTQPSTSDIDAQTLALAGYIRLWRSGKVTMDDLFKNASLTAKDALTILSSPVLLTNWGVDKPLRDALMEWLQQHSPQSVESPETLPPPVQFTLAEYYAKQRDPRAETLYKHLLAGKFPPGVWWYKILVMNDLSEYYGSIGQFDKAAETKLQIGQETTDETWLGNIKVEAARFYMQAGETEKAQALYAEAEKSPYAWAVGVALIDQGRALMGQKKYEEAIKVLSQPVKGKYEDQIEPVKRMLVGDAYYQSGDLVKAQQNIQEAITAYRALKNPLTSEGLQNIFNAAEKRLQLMNQWIKEPIQVDPKEMHITVNAKQLQNGPIIRRLHVRTYRDVLLTATTSNKNITAQVLSVNEWSEISDASSNQESEKEVIIKIITLPQSSSKALLTISSAQYAGFQAQVPVYLEVGAA